MKKSLSLVAIVGVLVGALMFVWPVGAQVQPNNNCAQCVRVATTTCTEVLQCPSPMTTYVDFTPTCDGVYVLSVVLVCSDGSDCGHCQACATLGTQGGFVYQSTSTSCGSCKECSGSVPNGQCPSMSLLHEYTYRLSVSMIPCAPGHCDGCNSHCRAVAYAHTIGGLCQAP